MTYQGEALPMVMKDAQYTARLFMSGVGSKDQSEANSLELTSTVIVDPDAATKVIIQTNIDNKRRISHPSFHDGSIVHNHEISDFTEEGFMICPSSITVFNLDDHDWYSVNVDKLKEKEWRLEALDRLVLDQDRKDTLIRLASSNSRRIQAEKSKDVIEGKGKGIVFLLHGPPGVGKTLTAEVLSEYTKRPLLKVNLGRIASHNKWEQSLERIFSNAEDWKAILLIDEAEIVLEKRTFERMTQNSWISVFLRKLEYFQGILILTTNLIDCIDEAFESRISYPLRFEELGRDDRHQIWTSFIRNMNILPAYKTTLINEVDRWSEAEINGRQIRNIVLMAENLAASDEKHPRLMPHHIDELLNVTLEFCDYNHSNPARMKKIQLTGLSY
ncbi:P-loop containing nucleoside triphosphate hydrolase protein [Bisporella sp. PMI_857]|nr:P-loop containing nucleoside triphosphate hydrolase protein [Bisporella sp. PMI_857]